MERALHTFKDGLIAGLSLCWRMGKVIVPVYIAIRILEKLGVIYWLADLCQPLMVYLGLPGEAAIILLLGYCLNIYSALGAVAAFDLTIKQINIIAIMLLFAHTLIIEGAVLKQCDTPALKLTALRLFFSIVVGVIANLIL